MKEVTKYATTLNKARHDIWENEEPRYVRETWKADHMRLASGITENILKIIYNVEAVQEAKRS